MIADESMRRSIGSHEGQFAVACSGKNGGKEIAAAHGPRSSGVELAWMGKFSRSAPGNPRARAVTDLRMIGGTLFRVDTR
jgi:hypothetical protein